MNQKNINFITDDITNTVMSFFHNGGSVIDNEPEIKYLERIMEVVSFLFEEFREDFDEMVAIRYGEELTEDQMDAERKLFVSMIAQKILNEIKSQ